MPNPMLELLKTRRSVKPDMLAEPAPSPEELVTILTIAARVPDHKKLAPWRFMVFAGDARRRASEIVAEACLAEETEPPSAVRLDLERRRFLRAPLVIGVVSRVVETRGAPEWEQVLSAGASAYNLCLAANAMGYATCWLTEWFSYSPLVKERLGLAANERFAGFVHIGTAKETPADRERPQIDEIVSHWQG